MFRGRVPGDDEPLWLDEDRQAAIQWQQEQDGRCGCCGFPKDEAWILPDDPPDVVDAKYARFHGHAIKCMAGAARDARRDEYQQSATTGQDGKKRLDEQGIIFPVVET